MPSCRLKRKSRQRALRASRWMMDGTSLAVVIDFVVVGEVVVVVVAVAAAAAVVAALVYRRRWAAEVLADG